MHIIPWHHFAIILGIIVLVVFITIPYLKNDKVVDSGPVFVMPDNSLIKLGAIAFCSMICEGAMFDWSVIYFKKVVLAPIDWIGAGFTAFMATMALGRFVADSFAHRFGLKTHHATQRDAYRNRAADSRYLPAFLYSAYRVFICWRGCINR
jgi:hypothetical protein